MSSSPQAHAAEAHDDHSSHVLSWQLLVAVWLILMGLTALTVWQWSLNLGSIDLFIAMVIATTKALLVALIFMHLRWDRPFNGLVFMSSLVFAGLFVGISLLDTDQNQGAIMTRRFDKPLIGTHPEFILHEAGTESGDGASGEHAPAAAEH